MKDCGLKVSKMTSSTSLPSNNTIEELLVIRVALDWEDVYRSKAGYYKMISKVFMFIETLIGLMISIYSIYISIPGHINPFTYYENELKPYNIEDPDSTVMFFLAIIATFEQAIFAYVNPNARWYTLKSAERLINTEIWKFRCRMGDYSIAKFSSSTVIRNLTNFTTELSSQTMAKAKLQESNLMGSYSQSISTHYQYCSWNCESYRINYNQGEIQNKDSDLVPLNSNLIGDYIMEHNIVDNHYSILTPEFYIRFRVLPTIKFYQNRIPVQQMLSYFNTLTAILVGCLATAMAYFKINNWLPVTSVFLGYLTYYREFNGYDRKVERYNATVNKLNDMMTWWMSLNRTDKNSRDYIEKLILDSEYIITQESISWSGLSINNQKTNNENQDYAKKIDDNSKNMTE